MELSLPFPFFKLFKCFQTSLRWTVWLCLPASPTSVFRLLGPHTPTPTARGVQTQLLSILCSPLGLAVVVALPWALSPHSPSPTLYWMWLPSRKLQTGLVPSFWTTPFCFPASPIAAVPLHCTFWFKYPVSPGNIGLLEADTAWVLLMP